jgi:hypothetical protein
MEPVGLISLILIGCAICFAVGIVVGWAAGEDTYRGLETEHRRASDDLAHTLHENDLLRQQLADRAFGEWE